MPDVMIDTEAEDRRRIGDARKVRQGRLPRSGSTAITRAAGDPNNSPMGKSDEADWRSLFPKKPAAVISATDEPGTGYVSAGAAYRPPGNSQPYTIHPKRDINAEVRAAVNPPNTGNLDPAAIPAMLAKNLAFYAPHDGITIDPLSPTPPRTLSKAESDAILGPTSQDRNETGLLQAVAGAGTQVQTQFGRAGSTLAAPAPHDWQEMIVKKYPQIGAAGSPENLAFTKAFNAHGAAERGMADADKIMSPMIQGQAKRAVAKEVAPPAKKIDASNRNRLDYLS